MGQQNGGAIQRLIQEFAKLPGIGPKSAERITHFLLAGDRRGALELATSAQWIFRMRLAPLVS